MIGTDTEQVVKRRSYHDRTARQSKSKHVQHKTKRNENKPIQTNSSIMLHSLQGSERLINSAYLTCSCSRSRRFSPSNKLICPCMFSVASRFRLRHSRAESRFFSNRRSFFSLRGSPSFPTRLMVAPPLLCCGLLLLMLLVEDKSSPASALETSCRSVVEDGAERFLVPDPADVGDDLSAVAIFFSAAIEGTEILETTGAVDVIVIAAAGILGGPVAEDCATVGTCSGCCCFCCCCC